MQHLDLLLAARVGLGQVPDLDQGAHEVSPLKCCLIDSTELRRTASAQIDVALQDLPDWMLTFDPSCRETSGATTTRSPGFTPAGSRRKSPYTCAAGFTRC